MKRILLTLAGLGSLAAAAFYVQGKAEVDAPPPALAASAPAGEQQPSEVEPAAADFDPDESFGIAADPAFEEEEVERTEVVVDVDVPPRLILQVWDGKKGKVAPEADVFVLEDYGGDELHGPFGLTRAEVAERKGRRYRASSGGRVELPRIRGSACVVAKLPGRFGMRMLRRGHADVEELTLRRDECVTVRVVDQRGRPVAGAPVALRQRVFERIDANRLSGEWKRLDRQMAAIKERMAAGDASQQEQAAERLRRLEQQRQKVGRELERAKRALSATQAKAKKSQNSAKQARQKAELVTKGRMEVRARRQTDEHGLAVFAHAQLHLRRAERWWPKANRDRFEAALLIPAAEVVAEEFRGRPLADVQVELRMPATGSVTLRTVDRDGRPFTRPVLGALHVVGADGHAWTRIELRKPMNEREIVFPFVALGTQLIAHCRLDDNDFRWRSPPIAGPQHAGAEVTADLVVAPDAGMLYGRIVDAAGTPLAAAETTFLINSARGRLEGEEVELDGEGRFHLPYHVRGAHAPPFRLQVRQGVASPVAGCALTLPALPTGQVVDLGDLQIGWFDRIAAGTVVDDLGVPIAGAWVQLQREREVGRGRSRLRWIDEAFTVTTSDADGRFWLDGELDPARYRLRVTAAEHFPFETVGLPGRDGGAITLLRRTRLVGTVVLPEWLDRRRVRVNLVSAIDPTQRREGRIHRTRGRDYIFFDWLRPGLYHLAIRVDTLPDAFMTVANVQVVAGQMDVHERLRDLPIGGSLFRYEVRAVDENGRRISPKMPLVATVSRADGTLANVGFPWRKGRVEILAPDPQLTVLPQASGFRGQATVIVPGLSEVQLLRVPPVNVQIPGLRALAGEEPVWISLERRAKAELSRWDRSSRAIARTAARLANSHSRLGERDLARFRTVADGAYSVVARFGDKRRGGLVAVPLGEIEVKSIPGGAAPTLRVGFDRRQVLDALAEVARRAAQAPR